MPEQSDAALINTAAEHLQAGRLAQCEAMARRLLRKPELAAEATILLARALISSGRAVQGVFELEKVVRQYPDDPNVLMVLYEGHIASRQPGKAIEAAQRAFQFAPDSEGIALSLASLLFKEGRLAEAEQWFEAARRINPQNPAPVLGLSTIYMATMRGPQAVAMVQSVLDHGSRGLGVYKHQAFQLLYVSGVKPEAIFAAHATTGKLTAGLVDGYPPRVTVTPDPDRVLTIGFLSPDFRRHVCSFFLDPIFAARDRSRLRFAAYSTTLYPDDFTQRFKSQSDVWRDVTNLNDRDLAQRITDDKVDIAIDLAGHTQNSRLAALVFRPAPITASYLGYPATTGTPGLDYRIVDSITDPPGAEAQATEKLLRLDPCFLCYRVPSDAPAVMPPPSSCAGHVTFGSFNVINKVSVAAVEAWAELLRRVPMSRLLLKSRPLSDPSVAQRLRGAFESRGIDPSRLDVMGWIDGPGGHLSAYGRIDIALDTFPYNGTTTTCEALWMGVPVVALRGQVHSARVGASLLSAVGHGELVGDDEQAYIRIAAELAADTGRLASIRSGLRARMAASPLCDEKGFAVRFESALRGVWKVWCESRRGA